MPEPDFRAEMNWLDRKGYEAVTLDQVENAWFRGGRLPSKPIVLTFDDGYMPQYTFAFPELAKHHWPGVLNLKAEGPDLYKKNVREMIAGGWELASHTINHLDMTTLDGSDMKHELAGSRAILRREFKVPVDNFCYPSGRFDREAEVAVKAAGYRSAITEIPRLANRDQRFALGRYEVLRSSGTGGVAAFLGT